MEFKTKKQAVQIVVSLSKTEKMPGPSWGISPKHCKVGSELRKLAGSVCERCYACEGMYRMPNVAACHEARLAAFTRDGWIDAMIRLMRGVDYFRWLDSGDLQDYDMLLSIIAVAIFTPQTKHWLPTKEYKLIRRYKKQGGTFPPNLCVRVSAAMVDGLPHSGFSNTTTVHEYNAPMGHRCPAYDGPKEQHGCRECRACWDTSIQNVSYAARW